MKMALAFDGSELAILMTMVLAGMILMPADASAQFQANNGDTYCIRNIHVTNDARVKLRGSRCNSENLWEITGTDGKYCLRNTSSDKYLSDTLPFYKTCDTGEKWEIESFSHRQNQVCIKNAYTGKHLGLDSDGYTLVNGCSTSELWRIARSDSGTQAPGFVRHTSPRMVAFFNNVTASDESALDERDRRNCHKGWREAGYAKGYMIKGTTNPAQVGERVGSPMKHGEAPRHVHDYVLEVRLEKITVTALGGRNDSMATGGKWHRAVDATEPSESGLRFVPFLVCEEQEARTAKAMPRNAVAFFNGTKCPADWSPYAPLNDRFAVPTPIDMAPEDFSAEGRVGGSDPDSDLRGSAHRHVLDVHAKEAQPHGGTSVGIELKTYGAALLSGRNDTWGEPRIESVRLRSLESIRVDGGTNELNQLPFIRLLACKKDKGRHQLGDLMRNSPRMTAFTTAQSCAKGWEEQQGTHGHLLVGFTGDQLTRSGTGFGGGQGLRTKQVPTHKHRVETWITLPGEGVTAWGGSTAHAAEKGSYRADGFTGFTELPIAYAQLRHCAVPKPVRVRRGGASKG